MGTQEDRMAKPVDDHSSSAPGTPVEVAKNNTDGTTDLAPRDTNNIVTSHASSRQQLSTRQYSGKINWLGSSYTGQDIKVVAHLYDDASDEVENFKQELEKREAYLNAIINGASALSGSSTLASINNSTANFDEKKKYIIAAMGLNSTTADEQAKRKLLDVVLYSIGREQVFGSTIVIQNLNALELSAKTELASVSERQKELGQLKEKAYNTVVLGTLQTLSVQSAREKYAVRSLGHSYAKAYTRGTRTLAGSMIFTVFEEHPLSVLIRAMGRSDKWNNPEIATLLPDQIPPVDITIIFANEYGSISEQRLYGVEFVNDSSTYSIENLLTEQVMQFTCRDIDIMTSRGLVQLSNAQRFGDFASELSGSRLLSSDEQYSEYLERLGIRRRLTNR